GGEKRADEQKIKGAATGREAGPRAGRGNPRGPAPATISGEGVSPAANAAERRSPPGSKAATLKAERGRCEGSGFRQRRIARSTAGLRPFTTFDGGIGLASFCLRCSSSRLRASNALFPVNSSYSTRPAAYKSLCTDGAAP